MITYEAKSAALHASPCDFVYKLHLRNCLTAFEAAIPTSRQVPEDPAYDHAVSAASNDRVVIEARQASLCVSPELLPMQVEYTSYLVSLSKTRRPSLSGVATNVCALT